MSASKDYEFNACLCVHETITKALIDDEVQVVFGNKFAEIFEAWERKNGNFQVVRKTIKIILVGLEWMSGSITIRNFVIWFWFFLLNSQVL
jgi:hypothetical protein